VERDRSLLAVARARWLRQRLGREI